MADDRPSLPAVLQGQTQHPFSLDNFRKYLLHKHSSENLDFYLWLIEYRIKFQNLPQPVKDLYPHLSSCQNDSSPFPATEGEKPSSHAVAIDINTETNEAKALQANDLKSLEESLNGGISVSNTSTIASNASFASKIHPLPSSSNPAEAEVISFYTSHMTAELQYILQTYILPSSTRELNITSAMRSSVIRNLSKTYHPSVFEEVSDHILDLMKSSSFPSFLEYAASNISPFEMKLRWIVLTGLVILYIGATAAMIVLPCHRWWRFLAWPLLVFAVLSYIQIRHSFSLTNHFLGYYNSTKTPCSPTSEGFRKPQNAQFGDKHGLSWSLVQKLRSNDKSAGKGDLKQVVEKGTVHQGPKGLSLGALQPVFSDSSEFKANGDTDTCVVAIGTENWSLGGGDFHEVGDSLFSKPKSQSTSNSKKNPTSSPLSQSAISVSEEPQSDSDTHSDSHIIQTKLDFGNHISTKPSLILGMPNSSSMSRSNSTIHSGKKSTIWLDSLQKRKVKSVILKTLLVSLLVGIIPILVPENLGRF
ncbi:hypothetical protein BKA69DRAFT_1168312 [Paraphysoderma sedebokerense]|nr:hypothetical protein BKA69DRAFT_1168312 [Paraphysoderma sedebokerense]